MRKSFGAEFELIRMIKRNATNLCTDSIEFLRKSVTDVNSNRPVFIQLGNFFLRFTAYEFLFYFLFFLLFAENDVETISSFSNFL